MQFFQALLPGLAFMLLINVSHVSSEDIISSSPTIESSTPTIESSTATDTASTDTDTASTATDTASTDTDTASTATDTASTGTDTASTATDTASTATDTASTATDTASTATDTATATDTETATGTETETATGSETVTAEETTTAAPSPSSCITVSGAQKGSACIFPFKARGVSYSECTRAGGFITPWCATAVDAQGNIVLGNWGDCPTSGTDCYPGTATETAAATETGTESAGAPTTTAAPSPSSCITISGAKKGSACIFPFKARGVSYSKCTTAGGFNTPWCATAVDAQGNIVLGNWGDCPTTSLCV